MILKIYVTFAGGRDLSNHTWVSMIQSNKREKNEKKNNNYVL